jgi:tRNA splicing endonuclease
MEIVAHGRLGTATKKSYLFCVVKDGGDGNETAGPAAVEYISVEWAGFG